MKNFLDYKPQKTQDDFMIRYATKQVRKATQRGNATEARAWGRIIINTEERKGRV